MNAKNIIGSILMLQILGCATTGKVCTPPVPSSDDAAELVIYRPHNAYGVIFSAPISIDDCIVGSLGDKSYIRHKIAAGTHKIRAEQRALASGGDAEISTVLAVGESVYVRYSLRRGEPFSALAGFAVTDKNYAETEVPALRGTTQ